MFCYVHMDRSARGACTACGEMICEECSVKLQNKRQCKGCIERGHHQQTAMVPHGPSSMMAPYSGPSGAMQTYAPPAAPVVFNIQGGSASSSAAASVAPQIVIVKRPFSHGIHLFLSIITAGLWIPIWLIAYLLHPK